MTCERSSTSNQADAASQLPPPSSRRLRVVGRIFPAASLVPLILMLLGCGSSSRTFGQAAEEWCRSRYGQTDKTQQVCFEVVTDKGPRFLEDIEAGERIKLEVLRLRAEHE